MASVFHRRCGCGQILSLRESCPVCAARERERLHAKGVAKHEEITLVDWRATARCEWLGEPIRALDGSVWAEPVQPKVPVWAQMPDTKKRFVSEAPRLDAYEQALKEAYRRDLEAAGRDASRRGWCSTAVGRENAARAFIGYLAGFAEHARRTERILNNRWFGRHSLDNARVRRRWAG